MMYFSAIFIGERVRTSALRCQESDVDSLTTEGAPRGEFIGGFNGFIFFPSISPIKLQEIRKDVKHSFCRNYYIFVALKSRAKHGELSP